MPLNLNTDYPPAPANVSREMIVPSATFRSEVKKVTAVLFLFLVVYLLMAAAALLLGWACAIAAKFVILMHLSWITLVVGCGILVMGILVVVYMFRFLFASTQKEQDSRLQISETEEPEFFEMVRRIADETGAQMPYKVFMVPEVRATASHDSMVRSLFFPGRKNLHIGAGMINSLNLTELKCVLAHELGHFSQKSGMQVGAYVYYANKAIYHLLYRPTDRSFIESADSVIHGTIAFFVLLAEYIVKGAKWILRGIFRLINQRHLILSREMEFHADIVSAGAGGSSNAAQTLWQTELAMATFQQTIDTCNRMLQQGVRPANMYAAQRTEVTHYAQTHHLPLRAGLPVVTPAFAARAQGARVDFDDQWASHPTTEDRRTKLLALGWDAPVVEVPAWNIFRNAERLQQEFTGMLYGNTANDLDILDDDAFGELIREEQEAVQLPALHMGYFNGHVPYTGKLDEVIAGLQPALLTPDRIQALFGENLDDKLQWLQQDIGTLADIESGDIDTRSFDFDGRKYPAGEAADVRQVLETELETTRQLRDQRDTEAAAAFLAHALATSAAQADTLKSAYQNLHVWTTREAAFVPPAREIFTTIQMLAGNNYNVAIELAQPFRDLYTLHEPALRRFFAEEMPDLSAFSAELQEKIRAVFLGDAIVYHTFNKPDQNNLNQLLEVCVQTADEFSKIIFKQHKAVLELQQAIYQD